MNQQNGKQLIQIDQETLTLKPENLIRQDNMSAQMLGLAVYAMALEITGQSVNLWDTILRFHKDDPITLALAIKQLARLMPLALDHEAFDEDFTTLMAERTGVKLTK